MNSNEDNKQTPKAWYVVYTRSRAEKKVYNELTIKNIESFLPLQKRLRQWKDRKKWVEIPLISGYCFVHINRKEYDEVLHTDNVVCYVTFGGKAAIIPENQIIAIKKMLLQYDFEITVSHENFEPGKKVEIIGGPLTGLQGELIKTRGKRKFMIRINQINSIFQVEIPMELLSALPEQEE